MDAGLAISARGVSKKFSKSLGHSIKYGSIDIMRNMAGMLSDSERLRDGEFWAVDDVSFDLPKGQTLGILGANGAGKSTLFRMLNGIFMPDRGLIEVAGRVGALIEVGAGFHPLLTGRENIFVNGSILGMSRREIADKFDSIVDFADIGDFIDSPVKYYSSGMYVRLGFAVAIHCDPDILLVDEVLAVGDRNFQIKCLQRIDGFVKEEGKSLILVSHNAYVMRAYTTKCLVLDRGKKAYFGETKDALSFYLNGPAARGRRGSARLDGLGGAAGIRSVRFLDRDSRETDRVTSGDPLRIELDYACPDGIERPIFGVNFLYQGVHMTTLMSPEGALPSLKGRGTVRVTVDRFLVPPYVYPLSVTLYSGGIGNPLVWHDLPIDMVVEKSKESLGEVELESRWEVL